MTTESVSYKQDLKAFVRYSYKKLLRKAVLFFDYHQKEHLSQPNLQYFTVPYFFNRLAPGKRFGSNSRCFKTQRQTYFAYFKSLSAQNESALWTVRELSGPAFAVYSLKLDGQGFEYPRK